MRNVREIDIGKMLDRQVEGVDDLVRLIQTTYRPWVFTVSASVAGRHWHRKFTARNRAGGTATASLYRMKLQDFDFPEIPITDIAIEAVSPAGRAHVIP